MMPLQKILVPTDFSELAGFALQYARQLADAYGAALHVLHVVSPVIELPVSVAAPLGTDSSGFITVETLDQVMKLKERRLQECVAGLAPVRSAAPVAAVRMGVPAAEIVSYAAEQKIDLIVIGTHARGILKQMLLGSTSESVLRHSPCPVLMVPWCASQNAASGCAARSASESPTS